MDDKELQVADMFVEQDDLNANSIYMHGKYVTLKKEKKMGVHTTTCRCNVSYFIMLFLQ